VTRLLRRLGFSPEPAPAEVAPAEAANEEAANELAANEEPTRYAAPAGAREESPGTTVLLRTCPLLEAAREHPTVVCSVHLGLVAGALGALGESAHGVQLQPFSRPGACTLTLPPDRSAADATR
jgi:predicted ArsR family transcriptional regulator